NQKVLQNLPLGRNYTSVAALVPGTGSDTLGPTFYGASSLENSFQTDGLNTTGVKLGGQGKKVPIEFIQEIEVRSGGYEAEFGKALGGNFNVLTKSGGNEMHGNVFGYYDDDSLGAPDQHEVDRKAVAVPALEVPRRYEIGFTLGGPVLRDRLWFFGAFDRAARDQDYQAISQYSFTTTGTPIPTYEGRTDSSSQNLFALNLSFAPSRSHIINLSVFGDPSVEESRTAPVPRVGPASANVTEKRTGGTDVVARWTGFLGSFIAEVQYGYHEEDARELSDFSHLPALGEVRWNTLQLVEGSGPYPLANLPGKLVDETYRRNALTASGSYTFKDHELKLGGGYELENPNRTARFSGTEVIWNYYLDDGRYDGAVHYYFAATPLNCTRLQDGSTGNFGYIDPHGCLSWQKVAEVRSDVRSRNLSGFIQDSWRPRSNLTVMAGLRYDQQELTRADGSVALKLRGLWSPRLSATWDPGNNGRAKVFASFGRYYQAFPQFLQTRALSFETMVQVINDSPGVDPVGSYYYAWLEEPWHIPESLDGMYQDEITAGGELQLGSSWSAGVRGVYRSLKRAIDDRCDRPDPGQGISDYFPENSFMQCALVNLGQGDLGQFRDPADPDCFEDFPKNTIPAPCEGVQARRYYRGIELTVQHRPTRDLYLAASYVYSKLTGNYDGIILHHPVGAEQATPGVSSAFDYSPVLTNNSGRLPSDRSHQAKVAGTYTSPFGLTVGLVTQLWSGQPLSLYGTTRRAYVGGTTYAFLTPRGSYGEMPSTYSIDLHLHYDWKLGNVTITPAVDVFNLTDVQRGLSRYQNYNTGATMTNNQPPFTHPTNPRFGRDVTWQTPRLIRLGLKVAY
ncbi:MAG: TonB-dependent receptor, partial [Acidobacteria bacterium]|nr:TonB-dependent receptor [Acidobacteriota bacterium]